MAAPLGEGRSQNWVLGELANKVADEERFLFSSRLPGLLINCNIATFLTGSSLIPLGLNWWQAIIGMYVHYPDLTEAIASIG